MVTANGGKMPVHNRFVPESAPYHCQLTADSKFPWLADWIGNTWSPGDVLMILGLILASVHFVKRLVCDSTT